MFKSIKPLKNLRQRLFAFSDESTLNTPSKVIILLLDFFVLILLFSGLSDHTRQLTRPYEYFPYTLQQVFINQTWNAESELDRIQEFVLKNHNHYSYRHDLEELHDKLKQKHPLAISFFDKIDELSSHQHIFDLFKKRSRLIAQKDGADRAFQETKDVYQTNLLASNQGASQDSEGKKFAEDNEQQISKSIRITNELKELDQSIREEPLIVAFLDFIHSTNFETQRKSLIKDFKSYERWYPIKEFFWQLLFLLPLFVVFYLWNSKSIRGEKHIQVLISTHLLIIATIPILIRVADFTIQLIPEHLFVELFALLKAIKIIALWHYFLIAFSVLVAAAMIVLIQKKILSQKRIHHKRALAGNCYSCGKKLPAGSKACPSCGTAQYENCATCGEERLIGTVHCNQCGKE